MEKKRILISHRWSGEGTAELAESVALQLRDKYNVRLDAWDAPVGVNIIHWMNEELAKADKVLLLYTPRYFKSGFTEAEWTTAFYKDPSGTKGFLIPILAEGSPDELLLPDILENRLYGSIVGKENKESKLILENAIEGNSRAPKKKSQKKKPEKVMQLFQSQINNLPLETMLFSGREDAINKIVNYATQTENKNYTIISGIGGVGKTYFAIKIAENLKNKFDVIWFVNAANSEQAKMDIIQLAYRLNLCDENESIAKTIDLLGRVV